MTPSGDPKSLTFDPASVQWDQTGSFTPALRDAPGNVRPSSIFFNRGQYSWPLVAQSKPAPAGAYWACALPMDATLSSGSTPVRQRFCVRAKNMYGMSVIAIGYEFVVQTGARPGAASRYITRLEIAPTNVDVAQGWNVDMKVVIPNPGEYGSPPTLFAALQAQLQLNIATQIKSDQAAKIHLAFPQGVLIM